MKNTVPTFEVEFHCTDVMKDDMLKRATQMGLEAIPGTYQSVIVSGTKTSIEAFGDTMGWKRGSYDEHIKIHNEHKNVVITKNYLRNLVNEALDGRHDEGAVNVNPVVDPQAALTDPTNANYTPQNKVEFGVAVADMVKSVPNDKVPQLFKGVKAVLDDVPEAQDKEQEAMKDTHDNTIQATTTSKETHEEALRLEIKKILKEVLPDPADVEADAEEAELAASSGHKKRGAYKATAMGGADDVGGAAFQDIAKELGFSVAGAKQAADKALLKARFLKDMDQDDLEILVLQSMNDYIQKLNGSGELTPADVQLMKDHPDVVRELDGFREYLDKVLRSQTDLPDFVSGHMSKKTDESATEDGSLEEEDVGGDEFVGKDVTIGGGKAKVQQPQKPMPGKQKDAGPKVDWNGLDKEDE